MKLERGNENLCQAENLIKKEKPFDSRERPAQLKGVFTMIQLESFALLILAASLAYILSCIFSYIEKCRINYELKSMEAKIKNDNLYKKRCEKLHDNAFFYYYTLATTRPEALCYDLASIDIERLKRNGLINKMYSKIMEEEKKKCQN